MRTYLRTNVKKLLLAAALVLAQSPAAASAPAPAFEVVSIKPNKGGMGVMIRMAPGGRFEATNITVKLLLEEAYNVKDSQISGAPGWLDANITISTPNRRTLSQMRNGSLAAMSRSRNID
jgi:hypothetical protein